jgi:hypothetical protein
MKELPQSHLATFSQTPMNGSAGEGSITVCHQKSGRKADTAVHDFTDTISLFSEHPQYNIRVGFNQDGSFDHLELEVFTTGFGRRL